MKLLKIVISLICLVSVFVIIDLINKLLASNFNYEYQIAYSLLCWCLFVWVDSKV